MPIFHKPIFLFFLFFLQRKLSTTREMSIIPCHYRSHTAPEITVLHYIHHSSHHDYVTLSVQISENRLHHILPLSRQNLSWISCPYPRCPLLSFKLTGGTGQTGAQAPLFIM